MGIYSFGTSFARILNCELKKIKGKKEERMKTLVFILCLVLLSSLGLFASTSDSNIKESDGKITVKQNDASALEYYQAEKKLEYNQDEKLKPILIPSGIDRGLISRMIKISRYEQIDFLRKLGIELTPRLNNTNAENFEPTEIQIKLNREQLSLLFEQEIDIVPQKEPSESIRELSSGERGRDAYTTEGDDGWAYEGDYIINGSEFYDSDVVLGNSFLTWGRAYYNLEVSGGMPLEQIYVGCRGRSNDNQYNQGGADFHIWNWNISEWDYLFHLPGEEPSGSTGWWAYDITDDVSTYVSSSGYISIYVYYDFDTAVDDDDYHVDWVIVSYSVNYTAPDIYSVETVNTIPSSEPYQYWDFEVDIDATSSNGVAAGVEIYISDDEGNSWGPFGPYDFIGYETNDNVTFGTWNYTMYGFSEPEEVCFTFYAVNCQGNNSFNVTVEVYGENGNAFESTIPVKTELAGNFPNPFNPETTIVYNLKENSNIQLEIFNTNGQKVKTLIDDFRDAGYHQIMWNGTDNQNKQVSSGLYFYRLKSNSFSQIRKMLLLK